MINPDSYILRNVPWQTFCTLTFKGRVSGGDVRLRALHVWVRAVAESYRIPDRFLLWASRDELGEKFGRPHFHAMIGGLRKEGDEITRRDIHRLRNLWVRQGFGFAMVRRFRNGADGIDYFTKPDLVESCTEADGLTLAALRLSSSTSAGANAYEFGKFDSRVTGLRISKGAMQFVAKRREIDPRSVQLVPMV